MARVTIEDCLRRAPNRFLLVHAVVKRVRQMRQGDEPLVYAPGNEDVVIALREVAAGKIHIECKEPEDQEEERGAVGHAES